MFLSYTEQNEYKAEGVEFFLKINIRVTYGGF